MGAISAQVATATDPFLGVANVWNVALLPIAFGVVNGFSRFNAHFVVIRPLSRGTHTIRSHDEFDDAEFIDEITYTINVG